MMYRLFIRSFLSLALVLSTAQQGFAGQSTLTQAAGQIEALSPDAGLAQLNGIVGTVSQAEIDQALADLSPAQRAELARLAAGLAERSKTETVTVSDVTLIAQAGQKQAGLPFIIIGGAVVVVAAYLVIGYAVCSVGASIGSLGGRASNETIRKCMGLPSVSFN